MSEARASDAATRVVLSYDPAEIDDVSRFWVENKLSSDSYKGYIRRTYGTVTEGGTVEEFVSKGCGVPIDVTLRVESVEGGSRVCEGTKVDVRPRD